jgi:hypothetical protein
MFLLLFLYLALQLIIGVFHLDMSFICWFRLSVFFSVFHGFFVFEEVRVGDKGSGDNTMVDV